MVSGTSSPSVASALRFRTWPVPPCQSPAQALSRGGIFVRLALRLDISPLGCGPIENVVGRLDKAGSLARAFADHPVGSGPFVLADWVRGSKFSLMRNAHYWKQGEDGQPLPYLDQVDVLIVPDDATRILILQSGQIEALNSCCSRVPPN